MTDNKPLTVKERLLRLANHCANTPQNNLKNVWTKEGAYVGLVAMIKKENSITE